MIQSGRCMAGDCREPVFCAVKITEVEWENGSGYQFGKGGVVILLCRWHTPPWGLPLAPGAGDDDPSEEGRESCLSRPFPTNSVA